MYKGRVRARQLGERAQQPWLREDTTTSPAKLRRGGAQAARPAPAAGADRAARSSRSDPGHQAAAWSGPRSHST